MADYSGQLPAPGPVESYDVPVTRAIACGMRAGGGWCMRTLEVWERPAGSLIPGADFVCPVHGVVGMRNDGGLVDPRAIRRIREDGRGCVTFTESLPCPAEPPRAGVPTMDLLEHHPTWRQRLAAWLVK